MSGEVISERGQLLLKTLVEAYIRDGQPVGSKALREEACLPVSPATVRNVMADLEERGLIVSPHTSAGRVPTAQGYRLFVDSLMTMRPIDDQSLQSLREELDPDKSPDQLVASASQFISSITHQAGLVTVPKRERVALRQVEFLRLSDNRVLVILVINERDVQNRIIHTSREYSEVELTQAANLVNQRYAGMNLSEIRAGIVAAMADDKEAIDRYMQASLDLARRVFEDSPAGDSGQDYVVSGEKQLISAVDPAELDKLKGLFDAFEQKKDILELVDRSSHADGVKLFIGEESGFEVLGDFSVVTAPYQAADQSIGVLGVIGPTRMAYEKVVPMVDVTAHILSMALNKA